MVKSFKSWNLQEKTGEASQARPGFIFLEFFKDTLKNVITSMLRYFFYNTTKYPLSWKSSILMNLYEIFLQKINVKPSLQKPNSVGALRRITFIPTLSLNPTTYMKSYWLLSFVGHYVLIFHHMIKEINFVKDHYWNVHQNIQSNGKGPCNTSKFSLV